MEMDAKYCLSGVAQIVAIIDPLCVMEMDIVSDEQVTGCIPNCFLFNTFLI